ncbi:hypothetical protein BH24ACT7_BH24ACT7_18530 [soil metagenome]
MDWDLQAARGDGVEEVLQEVGGEVGRAPAVGGLKRPWPPVWSEAHKLAVWNPR